MTEFNYLKYTIELIFVEKMNATKWWQFSKRRQIKKWREGKLKNVK